MNESIKGEPRCIHRCEHVEAGTIRYMQCTLTMGHPGKHMHRVELVRDLPLTCDLPPRRTLHASRDGIGATGRHSRGAAAGEMDDSYWNDPLVMSAMLQCGGPIDAPPWLSTGSSTAVLERPGLVMVHQSPVRRPGDEQLNR